MVCLYFEGAKEFDDLLKTLEINEEILLKDSYDFLELKTVGNSINNGKGFINYFISPIFQMILNYKLYGFSY